MPVFVLVLCLGWGSNPAPSANGCVLYSLVQVALSRIDNLQKISLKTTKKKNFHKLLLVKFSKCGALSYLTTCRRPLSPSKKAISIFWSLKMCNVLKRIQKQVSDFSYIFSFTKILISCFWDLRYFCQPDSETLTSDAR